MDTTSFLIAAILMMLAASYNAYWLVIGIAIIMILALRSWSAILLLILTIGIVVVFKGNIQEYAPYILFGLIILAMALGNKEQPQQEMPDMGLGGLGLGGGGGY